MRFPAQWVRHFSTVDLNIDSDLIKVIEWSLAYFLKEKEIQFAVVQVPQPYWKIEGLTVSKNGSESDMIDNGRVQPYG